MKRDAAFWWAVAATISYAIIIFFMVVFVFRYVGAVHSRFWTGGLARVRDLRPYQRPVILLTLVAAGLLFLYVLGYGLVDIVGMLLSAGPEPAD
jgi:hypothetical protein